MIKSNRVIRNILYSKGWVEKTDATEFRNSHKWKRYSHLIKNNPDRFIKKQLKIVETDKKIHSKIKSSYNNRPWFNPGDKVYVIVYDNKSPFGAKIVHTRIIDVMHFGLLVKGGRKDYWIAHYGNGHGIDADCIFKTYNEAKFYLYY